VVRALDEASPEALFVISGISQYTGAVIAVSLFPDIGAATTAWLRVCFAAIAVLAVSWRSARPWTAADIAKAAIFGAATALMNLFFYLAIDRIPLGKSVVIEFIGPIAVAAALTRSRRNAIALTLAVIGVVTLSGVEIDNEPLGLVYILLASAMWAAYIVLGRRVAGLDRGLNGLGVGLAIGAVALTPIGLLGGSPPWTNGEAMALCAVVGVLSTAVGYGIDQHVLRRIPLRRFSLLLALLPVTALIVGWMALGQQPTPIDLGGAALVIGGVIVQDREELTETPAT
jgi:inner membrane transporter RhtA